MEACIVSAARSRLSRTPSPTGRLPRAKGHAAVSLVLLFGADQPDATCTYARHRGQD